MKTARRLTCLGCFAWHYHRGNVALERMLAILELFNSAYEQALSACPSIDNHRRAARRHVRLARFYRRHALAA